MLNRQRIVVVVNNLTIVASASCCCEHLSHSKCLSTMMLKLYSVNNRRLFKQTGCFVAFEIHTQFMHVQKMCKLCMHVYIYICVYIYNRYVRMCVCVCVCVCACVCFVYVVMRVCVCECVFVCVCFLVTTLLQMRHYQLGYIRSVRTSQSRFGRRVRILWYIIIHYGCTYAWFNFGRNMMSFATHCIHNFVNIQGNCGVKFQAHSTDDKERVVRLHFRTAVKHSAACENNLRYIYKQP